jgi:hypothetical protein
MSVGDVAKRSGVPESVIDAWDKGRRDEALGSLTAYAEVVGARLDVTRTKIPARGTLWRRQPPIAPDPPAPKTEA